MSHLSKTNKSEYMTGTLKHRKTYFFLGLLFLIVSCKSVEIPSESELPPEYDDIPVEAIAAHKAAQAYLDIRYENRLGGDPLIHRSVRVLDVQVNDASRTIAITFNPRFADYEVRPHTIALADSVIRSRLKNDKADYKIEMSTMGFPLKHLIPNYYQENSSDVDFMRFPIGGESRDIPMIRNLDKPWNAVSGLEDRHIALWHSHGWYYNLREQRWEWQRPRLFNTTEDMLPMAFTLPYIIPMLEAAGAHVWVPRERDFQSNMVIVDNDTPMVQGRYTEAQNRAAVTWKTGSEPGFTPSVLPLTDSTNPFQQGTWRYSLTDTEPTASATWTPEIPKTGEYAVYISYSSSSENTTDARYTVYHSGGKTSFSINQQLGGGTWVYLGRFHFHEGYHPGNGAVELTNESVQSGNKITADAVRFGGGTGVVVRNDRPSERPRFLEGARYHLQFSGAPDSLVWKLNENNDYSDDFQSRGEWVNYLKGTPYGPNVDRSQGLGVPVELSLAFHTDAGVTRNDDVIGTLSIYSINDMSGNDHFPDGMSRLANRDFTDIMQTQIVDDIRALHDTTWVRRALRNARYSESMRPNVPSTLLELLSHQNLRDKEYAMDPTFRFDVSRSIYKSMLKFIAVQHGFDYVVQPLPVTHMKAEIRANGLEISWKPKSDPLEPTAEADHYVLYTRVDGNGFDNGKMVTDTTVVLRDLVPGVVYSFKVRALNDGGQSFPSEIISVSLPDVANGQNLQPVLIVNGFTRVSAPAVIKEPNFRGFARFLDAGVPDRYDLGFTGEQYNFDPFDDWVSDDRPGHGASHADYESQILAGNTHDFAIVHGRAIQNAGFGFVSASEAAIADGHINPSDYNKISYILGNQRQIRSANPYADSLNGLRFGIYNEGVRQFLTEFTSNGGGVFISGSHVGTDLIHRPELDTAATQFASAVLGYQHITNHASLNGDVFAAPMTQFSDDGSGKVSSVNDGQAATTGSVQRDSNYFLSSGFKFNTENSPQIYRVDAPDAIGPALPGSLTLLRYNETEFSAAVGYKGNHKSVIFGFPFETILSESDRNRIMKAVLEFLN